MRIIKRSLIAVLLLVLVTTLYACEKKETTFTQTARGKIVDASGVEYTFLTTEPLLYHLGELEFYGAVIGEQPELNHLGLSIATGLYAAKGDKTRNTLVRILPNDEWYSIYRKSSLPPIDISPQNCSRLEMVEAIYDPAANAVHVSCGKGITDRAQIAEFFSDIRSQPTAGQAGLYELVRQPNGMFKNCYISHTIYGFFEEEPYIALGMDVTSYNDQAYSVRLEKVGICPDYVLPDKWLELFGIQ